MIYFNIVAREWKGFPADKKKHRYEADEVNEIIFIILNTPLIKPANTVS